jgi:hypothetical protein
MVFKDETKKNLCIADTGIQDGPLIGKRKSKKANVVLLPFDKLKPPPHC